MEPQEGPAAESAEPAPAEDPAALVAAVGQALEKLAGELPEFAEVLDHYKSVAEQGAQPSGPVSMEAGTSGAKPVSMGR